MNKEPISETIRFDDSIYKAKGEYKFYVPEFSDWACYMFGNKPETNYGMKYIPRKGDEPNWFVRWMMKVCFDCTWVGLTDKQMEKICFDLFQDCYFPKNFKLFAKAIEAKLKEKNT
jgi:hypothetical protein